MKISHTIPALLSLAILGACSDDKTAPDPISKPITFDMSSGLKLFYNGNEMPSKTVSLIPDGNKATLNIYSRFNLSEISGSGLSGEIPAPGAIPGSPEITLSVDLSPAGDTWQFAGTSDSEYCTFSYAGYASDNSLQLFLDNVKLKTGGISPAVWSLAPVEKNQDGSFKSLPIYCDWTFNPEEGDRINLTPLVTALASIPIIPVYNNTAYMSISEALSETVKSIAFLEDGNMIFSYLSDSFGAMTLAQTLPNRFQYVISSPGTVKAYLDPMSLFGLLLVNTSGGTPENQIDLNDKGLFPANGSHDTGTSSSQPSELDKLRTDLVKSALTYFMPKLAEGLPLKYEAGTTGLKIYIDTPMALDMINSIVVPVLEDTEAVKHLMAYIENNPSLSPLLLDIEKLLPLLPAMVESVTTFRLGISLIPYTRS